MSEAMDVTEPTPEADAWPPQKPTLAEERIERKRKLTAALRAFGKFGFDEGVAGHFTVRDPEQLDHFWVNPLGRSFKQMRMSDLILVNHAGEITAGNGLLNQAAFAIHSQIHKHLPHVTAAAHTHSLYGKTFSTLSRLLDPLTQDSCAFFEDHVLFDEFSGVVLETSEGERIAAKRAKHKAMILQNHGLLTVGQTIDEAAWWFITMERTCQSQLLAEAAGTPVLIDPETARLTQTQVGSKVGGWFSFKPIYDVIVAESPDMFDEE